MDLNSSLSDFSDVYRLLLAFIAGSVRAVGLVLLFPLFSQLELGRVLKGAVAAAVSVPVVPHALERLAEMQLAGNWQLTLIAVREVAVGGALGLVLGLPFWAIKAVGEFVDNQRGIPESGNQDPASKSESSVMNTVLSMTAFALFVTMGGLSVLVGILYDSYDVWPMAPGLVAPTMADLAFVADTIARSVWLGLMIAAPLLIAIIIADVGLMLASKAGASLNLYDLSTVLRNVVFIAVVYFYIRYIVEYVKLEFFLGKIFGPELARRFQ